MKNLSILIPTLPVRIDSYYILMKKLISQINSLGLQDQIQLLAYCDTKEVSVGEKRNWLLKNSVGKYVCFIDDDDNISDDYIHEIFQATKQDTDCITFCGEYIEGNMVKDFSISTIHRGNYEDSINGFYRLPNHLCPVKREIALLSMFTNKNFGEDYDYAENINKFIKNEYHIKKKLYFYIFNANTSQTLPQNLNKKIY